jgi:hypothetical protein
MAWCRLAGAASLPPHLPIVADYLATLNERLSAGTPCRRHRRRGSLAWVASPASDPAVTTLLRQARRNATHGRSPPPAAARLIRMATACPGDLTGCAIGPCCC